jgi:hypothetical protein
MYVCIHIIDRSILPSLNHTPCMHAWIIYVCMYIHHRHWFLNHLLLESFTSIQACVYACMHVCMTWHITYNGCWINTRCWIVLSWIGLDWIGLDWIGLDWMGACMLYTEFIPLIQSINQSSNEGGHAGSGWLGDDA